jgi:hypothetical protein
MQFLPILHAQPRPSLSHFFRPLSHALTASVLALGLATLVRLFRRPALHLGAFPLRIAIWLALLLCSRSFLLTTALLTLVCALACLCMLGLGTTPLAWCFRPMSFLHRTAVRQIHFATCRCAAMTRHSSTGIVHPSGLSATWPMVALTASFGALCCD